MLFDVTDNSYNELQSMMLIHLTKDETSGVIFGEYALEMIKMRGCFNQKLAMECRLLVADLFCVNFDDSRIVEAFSPKKFVEDILIDNWDIHLVGIYS